ncbi:MAG: hydroxychlorobactene glucosyltransferase CruC [Desulfobulbaceae bacterium]
MFLLVAAVLILAWNLYAAADIMLGVRKMRDLGDIQPLATTGRPLVSVIVPACNEEQTIEPALRTLLAQDYQPLEIIVVNDRSTDRTGAVVRRLQREYPALRLIEITELPEGWLGKNHALDRGAREARGDFLLFTDADIHFERTTISRAMTLMTGEGLDHLALIFRNVARGLLLNAMMVDAGGGLFFLFKPWKVGDPRSRHFIGVGAFNLVRKSVYRAIGGHESLRMHPIDDIMLGKRIKQRGFRQDCLSGYDFLTVHWYDSPAAMIRGLMKNIFALYGFRVSYALAAVAMICFMTVSPVWGAVLARGPAQACFLLTVLVRLASFSYGSLLIRTTLLTLPFSFLTPYVNIYIILRGMITTLVNRGIEWRGTRYPLDRLRENQPLL